MNYHLNELKEWAQSAVLVIFILALNVMLGGCGIPTFISPNAYSDLSPAQIAELQKMQLDVYACSVFSGPPPSGRLVYIVVPRLDKKPDVKFGSDCQIK
jgi:hypothetical protein